MNFNKTSAQKLPTSISQIYKSQHVKPQQNLGLKTKRPPTPQPQTQPSVSTQFQYQKPVLNQNKYVDDIETDRDEDDGPVVQPVITPAEQKPQPPPMAKASHAISKTPRVIPKAPKRRFDNETCRLIAVEYPKSLKDKEDAKRKYRTRIEYIDANGQLVKKFISFGTKGVPDFVDSGDQAVQIRNHKSMKGYDSPDKPNFYRMHLLNREKTLGDSYIALRKDLGLTD